MVNDYIVSTYIGRWTIDVGDEGGGGGGDSVYLQGVIINKPKILSGFMLFCIDFIILQ